LGKPAAVPEREKRSGSLPLLVRVLDALRELYGKPTPSVTDPFELIVYENVADLADDERRGDSDKTAQAAAGSEIPRTCAARTEATSSYVAMDKSFPSARIRDAISARCARPARMAGPPPVNISGIEEPRVGVEERSRQLFRGAGP
jgi:hypothetical protein